jgi:hypothetical protein
MTVYTTIPQDDSNLDITITEAPDLVTLDLNSASFNLIGAVNSVNGLQGDVTLELGLPEAEVQTLIDDSIAAIDYPVDTVNGQTGDVVLTTNEISEDVNLYYTDARVDDYLNSGNITSIAFADTTISWNADDGTLEFPVNPDVTLQIGQENLIHVKNLSGTTLTNGTVVYVTGASGSKLTIDRADSAMEGTSAATIAIMTQELGNNAVGYATTEGLVRGLNTAAYGEGSAIYLNSNGAFSTTKPVTPDHLVPVGWVVRSHATEGSIFVHINNGQELEELHDVLITNPSDGQGIVWDALNGYWKNGDVTVDLTGYATEAYVDAAIPTLTSELTNDSGFITGYTESDPVYSASVAAGITTQNVTDWNSAFAWGNHALAGYSTFSGDYNDLINQPAIPADVGDLTDVGGLLLTAEDLYKNEDITLHVNNGTRAHWTYRTTYDAPYDIYNSDLIMQSFGVSTAGIFNLLRYKTAGDNIFLQITAEDTGAGDDGSHRTTVELQGSETIIAVNSDRLQINAPEIYSDNLTLNSGGNPYTILGGLTTQLNVQQSTASDDYGKLEVNAYKTIDLVAWDNFASPQSNMLRVIKRNIEGGVADEESQWNAIQWGSSDGNNFYQIGALGARYDNTLGHETKLQVFDPDTSGLLNNWTVHEHYLYGGKPIWNKSYNNTDRDALAVTQTGMLIWNTDAGALEVYDGSAWTAVGAGGGASALGDLTDVTLTALSDGDLLRYNGTAMEWQNTNLGLTLTPTLSISDAYAGSPHICTITNYGDYDDPAVFAQVKDSGGTVVVTNANITDNGDGTLSFTMPAVATGYVMEVKVQDFGDLASDTAFTTFDSLVIPAARYYRIKFINATSWNMIDRVQFWTGAGQTGTRYPTASMTSNTTPAPYVASADKEQSGYLAYEAFDLAVQGLGGSWWNIGSASYADSWLQLDIGSSIQVASVRFNPVNNPGYINCDGWLIYTSDTGAFAGEEILRFTINKEPGIYEYTVG